MMSLIRRSCVALLPVLLAVSPREAGAQQMIPDTASLTPGARVRVTWQEAERPRIVGWLDRIGSGELLLASADLDTLVRVPLSRVERLEVQTERHPRRKGFMYGSVAGSLVGLVGGLLIGSAVVEDCSSEWLCFDDLERGMYGLGGSLLGGLVFGVIGAAAAGDGWDVASSDHLSMSISGYTPVGDVALVTRWRPRW